MLSTDILTWYDKVGVLSTLLIKYRHNHN